VRRNGRAPALPGLVLGMGFGYSTPWWGHREFLNKERGQFMHLFDTWVEPFVPSSLALLGRLADEQRRDARPLILTVLHHGGLKNLILQGSEQRWTAISVRRPSSRFAGVSLDTGLELTSVFFHTPPAMQTTGGASVSHTARTRDRRARKK